ncbi:cytochrome P450 [Rhodofomes roseus]|uniref:Cytochrome P450 n=1 Tax=Rhodofomes roseus TaxID=34475 RepID=A0ABQ8KH52_9APHY|nr:cytochrome P450 [Rhodofomes roseus]KAH9837060.1 cytochrome P450 [Rhodofomes roseus]
MIDLLFFVVAAALAAFGLYVRRRRQPPLPPGPTPRWWSGNLHQLPSSHPWKTYAEWGHLYGPVTSFRVHTTTTVVLNTLKAASDLFDSRSSIYSDRPVQWMYTELAGRRLTAFSILASHPWFKRYRKTMHSGLNPRPTRAYRPIMQEHSRKMLLNFAVSPEQFVSHIRKNAASLILQISYGRTSEDQIDYFVKVVEDAVATQAHLVRPGQWLVNTYPILRFIPSWFPFAEFKRVAAYYKEQYKRVDSLLYTWAKDQIKTGDYVESFVSLNLRPDGISQEEDDILRWCSSALYAGASDTTVGILISFVLLMTLHPEVQRRAQEEVDRVCEGRLPTWDDEPNMPYVGAMIKEVMRWNPVAPLGLPHVVTQDDMYEGYLIPKGVTVLANIWAIAHDETMYPSPFAFDPNRFLGPEPQFDPRKFVFGFGRRVCPGQHFAETSLFLNVSSLLAVFNIAKAVDEKGREIEPDVRWTSRLTSHAENFACNITVRSPELLESLARTD